MAFAGDIDMGPDIVQYLNKVINNFMNAYPGLPNLYEPTPSGRILALIIYYNSDDIDRVTPLDGMKPSILKKCLLDNIILANTRLVLDTYAQYRLDSTHTRLFTQYPREVIHREVTPLVQGAETQAKEIYKTLVGRGGRRRRTHKKRHTKRRTTHKRRN